MATINKTTICAIGAIIGVAVTAFLASRGGKKEKEVISEDMDTKEKTIAYAKVYGPAVVSGVATVALVAAGHKLHVRKEVALAGVAAMAAGNYKNLDEVLAKQIGFEEYSKIKKKVLEERFKKKTEKEGLKVEKVPENTAPSTDKPDDLIIIYEQYTDQLIYTTKQKMVQAELEINKSLCLDFAGNIATIINALGGHITEDSKIYGWDAGDETFQDTASYNGGSWISFNLLDATVEGIQCYTISYSIEPDLLDEDKERYLG